MIPFILGKLPQIYFGAGKFKELSRLMLPNNRRILLITGASSFYGTPSWDLFIEALKTRSVEFFHASVSGEPSPELVDQIVSQFKRKNPGLVISIGGGSVIDAGKAVSAMLLKDESVYNYLEGVNPQKVHDGVKIPFIAVPTTAGTGSEAAKNAVLSRVGADGFKRSIRHDNFVPDTAVVDPELMVSCPPSVTSACGMDAFVQLLESYVSKQSNAFTDALAFSGMAQVVDALIPAYQGGANIEARSKMAYGALMSGITLAHAGLGVVHGFASVLGGLFDIPHGVICGALVGAATRTNIRHLKEIDPSSIFLEKYARAGALVARRPYTRENMDQNLGQLVQQIDRWADDLNIPKINEFGISIKDIDRIVAHTENKNNPVNLSKTLMKEILTATLS
jgi:alcohol dehydrogenase class IV